jgi:hypothetical protein
VQNQFYDYTSKLFQWRKNNEAVHFGKMTHYIPENNTYVYFRYTDTKTVMVILNNGNASQKLNTKRFQENIKNYTLGKDVLTDTTVNLKTDFTIEAQSVLVLELE